MGLEWGMGNMKNFDGCVLANLGELVLQVVGNDSYIDILDDSDNELLTKWSGKEWRLGIDIGMSEFEFTQANVTELFARGAAVDAWLATNLVQE